ncbi:MAG: protein phosphatase CheZ [Nitrospiria bacterium]
MNAKGNSRDKKGENNPEGTNKLHEAPLDPGLYEEVGDLAKHLNTICSKIQTAQSFMKEASTELPLGTDQLSEVTRQTEAATQKILDDTEEILGNQDLIRDKLEGLRAALMKETLGSESKIKGDVQAIDFLLDNNKKAMLNLVSTLSFQDPAGQQIKKVEEMLQGLQSRLLKLVITLGERAKGNSDSEQTVEALLTKIRDTKKPERLNQRLIDSVLKTYGF